MWPQTYKWVYEERWLENFFSVLEDNSDWITVMTPAEYMERHKPLGRLYIPCASYPEMLNGRAVISVTFW
jgi:alpha-amylase